MRALRPHRRAASIALVVIATACSGGDGGTGPARSIALSLNRTSESVVQGGTTSLQGTLTRAGGYTGTVTFTVEGVPAGVSATVGAPQTSGASTTVTFSIGVSQSTTPGTYPITARGKGTGVNDATATYTLTVTAIPDYSLSVTPTTATIVKGASQGDIAVAIARTSFDGAVTLSLGGAPSGVTATFTPDAPTLGTATMSLAVGASVAAGTYTLAINGAGAPGVRTTPFTLTVAEVPDYSLSVAPASLTLQQGSAGNATVTIGRTNFGGAVTLALGGPVPNGVTAAFAPAAPTTGPSTLTLTVGASVAPGTYALSVSGTGTPGTRSTPLQLVVTQAPDYSLSLTPASASIARGGSRNDLTVGIARTAFSGPVTLALAGPVPSGVSATFEPSAPTITASTMAVSVGVGTPVGTYALRVDGTGTPGTRSTPFTLTVTDPGSFTISVTPTSSVTVQAGADANRTITINRTNYTADVTLTAENLPAGMSATFAPNPANGNSVVLTLAALTTVAPSGTPYVVTVRASGPVASVRGRAAASAVAAAVESIVQLDVSVSAAGSFTISVSPTCGPLEVPVGFGNDSRSVDIARTNFAARVNLTVEGLPPGVGAIFQNPATTANSEYVALVAYPNAVPGSYNATVRASGPAGDMVVTTPIAFTVVPGAASSVNVMTYNFDNDFEGWQPGTVCSWLSPGTWGTAGTQEQMLYLDGVGHPGRQNAWISKWLQLPADATTIEIDVSGHPVVGGGSIMRVRVIDGPVSTMVTQQAITNLTSSRTFSTRTADVTPWAGKLVLVVIEQDANGYQGMAFDSAEQLWITSVCIR